MIPADHSILLFRFSEQRWIDSLVKGKVSFSCAGAFIEQAKRNKDSTQADAFEGYFARLHKDDPRIQQMRDKLTNDLEEEWNGDYVLLRRYSSKFIPIFCVYAFTCKDALQKAKNGGTVKIIHEFDERMFSDFSASSQWDSKVVADDHRMAMVTLQVKPFIDKIRMVGALNRITVLSDYVEYDLDENETFFIEPTDAYLELSHKRKAYSFQHEARFWIPTMRMDTTGRRLNIDIGNMKSEDYEIANEPLIMSIIAKLKKNKQKA